LFFDNSISVLVTRNHCLPFPRRPFLCEGASMESQIASMSSKKRRAEDYEVEDLKTSPSAVRTRKHIKASSPSKSTKSAFKDNKLSLWQQTVEIANEQLKADMNNATSDDDIFNAANEYERFLSEGRKLYFSTNGDVVAMGMDDGFQLGIQSSADDDKATEYTPTLVRNLPTEGVVQVAAGGLHSAAVSDDGEVYTWGVNDDGALGRDMTEDEMHNVKRITEGFAPEDKGTMVGVSCGDSHSLFLTLRGKVYTTGMYKDTDSGMFKQVPSDATKCKGFNKFPVPVVLPKKARAIAAGFSINVAILEDDSLVSWGKLVVS
jgi:alpha-tubulin suppressor-like RCC1 family protein